MENIGFVAYSGNIYCNKLANMSTGQLILRLTFDLEVTSTLEMTFEL